MIEKTGFGTVEGKAVYRYVLTNANGLKMTVLTYGGIVASLETPDRDGKMDDIVLGFNDLAGYRSPAYLENCPYFGAIIGRYGNRIAYGRFSLGGREFTLEVNNGMNCLHGGNRGFDKVVWDAKTQGSALELTYVSPDGEGGYPGTLACTIVYALTDGDELSIDYRAFTDRATVVNPTHHSYFNLAGEGSGDVLGTRVTIDAEAFTPVDNNLIPTGELRAVAGTPMDFRAERPLGERIDSRDEQIAFGSGYDHNWVLNRKGPRGLFRAASAYEAVSGRFMEVFTTEPGMQLYTGNFLDGTVTGKSGKPYGRRGGFCFETQHFPDSPNKSHFPGVTLHPGQVFESSTRYRFSVPVRCIDAPDIFPIM